MVAMSLGTYEEFVCHSMYNNVIALYIILHVTVKCFKHILSHDLHTYAQTTVGCTCRSPKVHRWEQGSVGESLAVTDTR